MMILWINLHSTNHFSTKMFTRNQNIFHYPNPIHRDQCPHHSRLARVHIIVDLQGKAEQGKATGASWVSCFTARLHSEQGAQFSPQCTVYSSKSTAHNTKCKALPLSTATALPLSQYHQCSASSYHSKAPQCTVRSLTRPTLVTVHCLRSPSSVAHLWLLVLAPLQTRPVSCSIYLLCSRDTLQSKFQLKAI